ncbi:MAG: hypothetical protein FWF57_02890 [Defluviitaleaceae bacterium]|nr:hypothetical protein [Defluviitaleaceae bacterium]
MRYKRIFITLKSSLAKNNALGRCILENHNEFFKISISVQNLKPQTIYNVIIITGNEEIYTNIGTIATDKRGKGDTKIDMTGNIKDLNNLESIEKIIILHKIDNTRVLEGENTSYQNKSANIKNIKPNLPILTNVSNMKNNLEQKKDLKILPPQNLDKIEQLSEKLKINKPENLDKENKVIIIKTEPEKNLNFKVSQAANLIEAIHTKKNFDDANIEIKKEIKQKEVIIEQKETMENKLSEKEKFDKIMNNQDSKEKQTKKEPKQYITNNEIDSLFKYNEKINPFKKQKKNFKWIKISLKETIYLPINFWSLLHDPFVVSCYKKHEHLILGICEDFQKEYLLGLPDIYTSKNKVRANNKGFVQFKSTENTQIKENEGGYWIMPVYVV